ncbi:MAG: GNAT family N-acetyltransferase [Pseudomonadota bacterium]
MGITDVIRVTNDDERQAAFAIREAVFVDEQGVDQPLEFDGLDDESDHLLAKLDGRPVGTLRLRWVDDASAKIERVAVLRGARGRAVGAALMKVALDLLRERGARSVKLHAQTHALDFYEKLGFAAHGDVFDEDGLPHRAMHLAFEPSR